jgi:hypothetical protein
MSGASKTAEDIRNLLEETEKMRGLGDAVARAAKKLGVHECDKCRKRRDLLNKVVPFRRS